MLRPQIVLEPLPTVLPLNESLSVVRNLPDLLLPFTPPPQVATPLPSSWCLIPQAPYSPGKQWNFVPIEPISFVVNCRKGMNMGDALRRRYTGLDGRGDQVLQDVGGGVISLEFLVCLSPSISHTNSLRLEFPGYPPNSSPTVIPLVLAALSCTNCFRRFLHNCGTRGVNK